jgi:hypothetical protein
MEVFAAKRVMAANSHTLSSVGTTERGSGGKDVQDITSIPEMAVPDSGAAIAL